MEVTSPVKDGLVSDWNLLEELWQRSFKYLDVDPVEHPLMYCEASWNPKEDREKLCELAFEKFGLPAFYLGRSAALSAYAAGRSTALVVDSSSSMTSVVSVYDGYVVKKSIEKSAIGGDYVSDQAAQLLKNLNIDIVPQYLIKTKTAVDATKPPNYTKKTWENVTNSFHEYAIRNTLHEFKEAVCHVCEVPFDEKALKKRPLKKYEFSTGYNTAFGPDRFRPAEGIFNPLFLPQDSGLSTIPQMIHSSINKCDVDLRPHLNANVVLTGANSLLHGFPDRLYMELHQSATHGGKVKVHAAGGSSERKFGAWIGGSILSSLDNFSPLWISKQQYEEMGASVESKIH